MLLSDPVTSIKGIGEKTAGLYGKLGINTVEELLEYYPRDYELIKPIVGIAELMEGEIQTIEASVAKPQTARPRGGKQAVSVQVRDSSGTMYITWYHMPHLYYQLKMGTRFLFRGRVSRRNGVLTMQQPKLLKREEFANMVGKELPIYSLTKGMTNHMIGKAVKTAIEDVEFPEDFQNAGFRREHNLISYKKAVELIHFPKKRDDILTAGRRFIFDEFYLFSLAIRRRKELGNEIPNSYSFKKREMTDSLLKALPFSLTNAQKNVLGEIFSDMNSPFVMNRLVQGDVGSGKTILALAALLYAAENGFQGAIMAPTEILARQHYNEFEERLAPYNIRLCLLIGSMKAGEKKAVQEKISNHEVDIIVGTHALIQETVSYDALALVVTDEQHRFGVKQREKLSQKGNNPHILVMSATPIPRTLAIILYGELSISIVDEKPSERLPVKNCVVNTDYRPVAYKFIREQVEAGRQAYIICPMVEESENIEAENVVDYTDMLKENMPAGVRTACIHGQMKADEKDKIMGEFLLGRIDILVSTTVIEVGVNVPNATVMMIENSERFGLAQLHQLRGRVGRGREQSYCIFMMGKESKEIRDRLSVLNESNDGFYIAKEDLKSRGPGDFFGIRQSGIMEFKLGDIFQNADILKEASEAAQKTAREDVKLMLGRNKALRQKMEKYGCEWNL